MTSFDGQVVILTGASQGIGHAIALALASERARLVLAARDEAHLEAVAAECRALGAETLVVSTDVTSEEACRVLVARAVERFGRVDTLINNAGIGMSARFEELTDLSVYEKLMRVNFLGSVYPTFHALPELKKSRGRIAVVASLLGFTGAPTRSGYCASKHAVVGFFDSLRIELAESGVSVTIAAPDFVVSEIHRRSLGPDGLPQGKSPMQESAIMSAEECARLIVSAIRGRERLAILSLRGRVGRLVRLLAPGLIDRVAARAIARGR
ncbi:MAG: SDR family oxidoreductase [Thermoanaerobaculia bacterium]